MFRFLPEQASTVAPHIDWVNNLITDISVFFTAAIVGVMIYFAIRYRQKDGVDHETPQIHGNNLLELVWTVVPTIVCIYVAYWGVKYWRDVRHVPRDVEEIKVTGQKWKWEFEYSNGKKTTERFAVPVNKPVKLVMRSRDVLHSFYIPSMRIKNDVLPGMYSYLSFTPTRAGTYHTFCTEYCGMDHWNMRAELDVLSEGDYQRWLLDRSEEKAAASMSPRDLGEKLYTAKGCNACHSLTGVAGLGPSFLKLFGKNEELADGTTVAVDENYIQESILKPAARTVKGYQATVMPVFEGQLQENELVGLVEFIKSIDGSQKAAEPVADTEKPAEDLTKLTPEERGKKLYSDKLCSGCHSLDGSKMVGPTFKGIIGRGGKLQDGTTYVADEGYIKSSIQNPSAQVVEGFPAAMPPMGLTDSEISDLIAFMKTQKE